MYFQYINRLISFLWFPYVSKNDSAWQNIQLCNLSWLVYHSHLAWICVCHQGKKTHQYSKWIYFQPELTRQHISKLCFWIFLLVRLLCRSLILSLKKFARGKIFYPNCITFMFKKQFLFSAIFSEHQGALSNDGVPYNPGRRACGFILMAFTDVKVCGRGLLWTRWCS